MAFLVVFHPETALFPNLGVNQHACVCGVDTYASVQALDSLTLGKIARFLYENGTVSIHSFRMNTGWLLFLFKITEVWWRGFS